MEPAFLSTSSSAVRRGLPPALLAAVLFHALPLTISAYVPLGTSQPVPPLDRAWIETTEPDPRTVLLWKFSTEADRSAAVEQMLESDDLLALLDLQPEPSLVPSDTVRQPEPTLAGDARLVAGAGRFGGGLRLEGQGYVHATVPLTSLVRAEGGWTLDFWFRAESVPAAGETMLLAAVGGQDGQPLVTLSLTGDETVSLAFAGASRLQVAAGSTHDGWRHGVLVWQPRSVTLWVNHRMQRTESSPVPDWLGPATAQLGATVMVGGAPERPGWRGLIDEVRISRGVRYFYRWALGEQERADDDRPTPVAPPFFRSSDVLTRLRFDGTLAPETLAAAGWAGTADQARFEPGVRGQSLDLSQGALVGLQLNDLVFPPQTAATLEFWFRPLNWHNFYRGDYHGTDLPSPQRLFTIEGDGGNRSIMVHRGTAGSHGNLAWTRLHPGAWTHVLITIAGGRQNQYLNGVRTRFGQVWLGGNAGKPPFHLRFANAPVLIDELSIYPWEMRAEEAWNAYARWLPDAADAMRPLPHFELAYSTIAHSWHQRDRLRVTLTCLPINGVPPRSADIELRDDTGAVLLQVEQKPLDATGVATVELDRALPFGHYPVVVRSRDAGGAVLGEETHAYVRERPAWYENTLGMERTVPAPWIPIAVDGSTLRLVGREIVLGDDGLPARITTLGQAVLGAPVSIQASLAGEAAARLQGRELRFTEIEPDRVAWSATAGSGGLIARIDAWLEFDGLLYCNVTLLPADGAGVTVSELLVDVPMTPEVASQLIANGGGGNFRVSWLARGVPAGDGSVWNSRAQPYPAFQRAIGLSNTMPHIWLGNDSTGLYFGGDNDQGWTVGGERPAQEIVRAGDTVSFRMNIIREPVTVGAGGHAFHFVLLPTPAKPEPPNWRHEVTEGGYWFGAMDSFGGHCMKTDPANPEDGDSFRLKPKSWEHAAAMSAASREKWNKCILYADASWPRPGPSFADWNHDLWAGTGRIAWIPEFEDYVVWIVNEYLERDLIDGIYFDDVSVGHTFSLAATAYPFEGAKEQRRVGFTALAQRRVLMRLWRLFLAHGKEPGISVHMTYCYEVPVFSFCNYLYNAEIFSGVKYPGARDAMDEWPAERMRILAGAVKWGAGHPFISTLPRGFDGMDANWVYRQKRTEDAAFLTADVPGAAAPHFAANLRREGVFAPGVRGYPFWATDGLIAAGKPDGAHIQVAVYAYTDRAFVIVANRDREPRDVTLRVKDDALFTGARGIAWRDIDPGLQPPPSRVASRAEMPRFTDAASPDLLGDGKLPPLDIEALGDLLDGTTPEERALAELKLRIDGDTAAVLVRPRDFRILEARPTR